VLASQETVCSVELDYGSPSFLWQTATPLIVGWFADHTLNNNNKWYTLQPKSLCNFYNMHTYECGRGPQDATWRSAGWRHDLDYLMMLFKRPSLVSVCIR
jgi:hypothetical protein